MNALHIAVGVIWVAFWGWWLWSARTAKTNVRSYGWMRSRVVVWIALILISRVWRPHGAVVHSLVVGGIGTAVLLAALAYAIWARLYLGTNWGMPMSVKAEPELVTTGPYRWARHPIYTGIVFGLAGTALATNYVVLILAAVVGAMFWWSARVEEGNLMRLFPEAYPAYRKRTKMLIPFLL